MRSASYQLKGAIPRCKRRPAVWPILFATLGLAILISCGYRLSGTGKLPGAVNSIAVTVLANRTAETGLETKATNAIIDELTRRRQDLVVGVDQADAVLSGTIDALSTETLARSGALTAVERRVLIVASLTLKDRKGKVLWKGPQLKAEQAYPVTTSGDTERNRQLAIGQVVQRLAEYAYERLTDNF